MGFRAGLDVVAWRNMSSVRGSNPGQPSRILMTVIYMYFIRRIVWSHTFCYFRHMFIQNKSSSTCRNGALVLGKSEDVD
jgi:hypothetical protein